MHTIGVFDSGMGGLNVLHELSVSLRDAKFIYAYDGSGIRWGTLSAAAIFRRACACADRLLASGCEIIVIACNTASCVCGDLLQEKYPSVKFVPVIPPVSKAVRAYPGKRVALACTPASAQSERVHTLIADSGGAVILSPQPMLAQIIEKNLDRPEVLKREARRLERELKPAALILGCTHYIYLKDYLSVPVFDGVDEAVCEVKKLLAQANGTDL